MYRENKKTRRISNNYREVKKHASQMQTCK